MENWEEKAYTVQVERMREAHGLGGRGERDLDRLVRGQGDDTSCREEVLGEMRTAQYLKKHRHGRRSE